MDYLDYLGYLNLLDYLDCLRIIETIALLPFIIIIIIIIINGYPLAIITKCITQFMDKIHENRENKNKDNSNSGSEKIISLFLPYLGEASIKLKRSISRHIKGNIPNCKLRVIFSSKRRLSNYFRFKDVIPKCVQSHLVYKICCAECNL